MYLIVDIGNTLAKLFLYKKSKCIVQQKVVLALFIDIAASVIKNHPDIEGLIYSDVSNHSGDFFEKLSNVQLELQGTMDLMQAASFASASALGSSMFYLYGKHIEADVMLRLNGFPYRPTRETKLLKCRASNPKP